MSPSRKRPHLIRQSPLAAVFIFFVATVLLSGCEHNVSVSTAVHPDGSLDRTIVLHESDSINAERNIFGISKENGWEVLMEPSSKGSAEADKESEVDITFKKHFASAEEANVAMNSDVDTAFHISSNFEKRNRWFYTSIVYRDTYKALNLFNTIPKEQYFTKEDFAFIDRLPAEGAAISKADSLYLARLNEKIFELYGSRTIFEEFYQHLITTMRQQQVASRWEDTLVRHKENIYQAFVEIGNFENGYLLDAITKFNVPLPPAAKEAIKKNTATMERRLEFLSDAYSGKYVHTIEVPWTVVESNADSVIGNHLFWRPPVLKFLLSDYTMMVTARKMNVGAASISAIIILSTLILFLRRRAKT